LNSALEAKTWMYQFQTLRPNSTCAATLWASNFTEDTDDSGGFGN
jgi:hypothetical protein